MNKELFKKLMIALKVDFIALPVAQTSHGQLAVNMRKDEDKLFFTLDSVPVEDELNSDLIKLVVPECSE